MSAFALKAPPAVVEKLSPYAWPMLRIAAGLLILPHGLATLMRDAGIGDPQALIIAAAEILGGLALIAGFMTRLGAMALVAVIGFGMWRGSGGYSAIWAVLAVAILLQGGGALSLDTKLAR